MWYYCVEGQGEFKVEGNRIILQPGHLLMTLPDTPYSCKPLPGGCTVHFLGFTGPSCTEILHVCGMAAAGIFQLSSADVFNTYMDRLLQLQQQNSCQEEFSKLCYGLMVDLAPHIERMSEPTPSIPVNEAVQMIIEILEKNYSRPISLQELADEVHLSKEYLCTLFKRETGHTILQQLTLIRIGWARLFLEQYPDKRVCEVGQMCGFDSTSYFGKKFREIVGLTPEKYRHVHSVIV